MSISLYDVTVTSYLQILDAVGGFLDKALAHCRDAGLDAEEIVETRLFPDMLPFRFQVQSAVMHSAGAIEGVLAGVFNPVTYEKPPHDYAGLQGFVAGARATLRNVKPEALNARADADLVFEVRDTKRFFVSKDFLLSASLPNFYFHATTAYDILRMKGVPLGKRDFLGALRLKEG